MCLLVKRWSDSAMMTTGTMADLPGLKHPAKRQKMGSVSELYTLAVAQCSMNDKLPSNNQNVDGTDCHALLY